MPEDDAVGSDSRKRGPGEGREVGADTIECVMRERVRDTIERIVEEELETALGAARSARVGEARAGYRHGTRSPAAWASGKSKPTSCPKTSWSGSRRWLR